MNYLSYLIRLKVSYSVINTHKSMLIQTLKFFDVKWVSNPVFIPRLMKGFYNMNPPIPKCKFTWDVSKVLLFIAKLMPLKDLTLKMLTLKLITLVALTTASRAQTLLALNVSFMSIYEDKVVFQIQSLLKTSRPGIPLPKVVLYRYHKSELCVLTTLQEYLKRTSDLRKCSNLFISYKTFDRVTTCTLARWLKSVLVLADETNYNFTAHSFRGTAASVAYSAGVSMKDILDTANWTNAKTFHKFYHKDLSSVKDSAFANSVLNTS